MARRHPRETLDIGARVNDTPGTSLSEATSMKNEPSSRLLETWLAYRTVPMTTWRHSLQFVGKREFRVTLFDAFPRELI